MKQKFSWSIVFTILMVIFISGCTWGSGFTIVLPDREIEVSIPKTGAKIPEVDVDLFGRDRVNGSGDYITVDRDARNFDQISITGSGEVSLIQGDKESLTVTIEDNLLEYLETKVKTGTLTLGWNPEKAENKDLRPSRPIRFDIVVKDLTRIYIYGSADVQMEELTSPSFAIYIFGSGDVSMQNVVSDRGSIHLYGLGSVEIESFIAKDLDVEIPGVGDVKLAGEVEEQEVSIAGHGDYRAGDLLSSVAYVTIHGSGDATLWATEYLEGEIFGSGHLKYYGDPKANFLGVGSGKFEDLGEH